MNSPLKIEVAAFYWFQNLAESDLSGHQAKLEALAIEYAVRGLVILGSEGINATVCGQDPTTLNQWLELAAAELNMPPFSIKRSVSPSWPFRKFAVRLRNEIVTLGKPEILPDRSQREAYLTPEEWQKTLDQGNALLIDTRNKYETRIGTFRGALDPQIEEFHEFPKFVENLQAPHDQPILIFCTGGIRCEKAAVEMKRQGFQNVKQLEGGILSYLEKFPNRSFAGECFVFDNRVAVDQMLQPSLSYRLCPHCGQPADQKINCVRCDAEAMICPTCLAANGPHTCSKNCAHHHLLNPGKKGRNQGAGYRFRKTQRRIKPHL